MECVGIYPDFHRSIHPFDFSSSYTAALRLSLVECKNVLLHVDASGFDLIHINSRLERYGAGV